MTYEEFKINLAEQVALRKQFKERLIVFDVLSKELIAEFFGFPIETYYQYSFDDWMTAKQRFITYLEQMYRNIREVDAFCGEDLKNVPFKDWKAKFEAWANSNNFEMTKVYTNVQS